MVGFKSLLLLTALLLVGWCQEEVEVTEPATIVIAPAQPEHTSGGRLTLTCAAYGEPLPTITWSLPNIGISNFTAFAEQSDLVNINTTVIDGMFVVSLLELCDVNYTSGWLAGGFVCEADNGVTEGRGPPLGVSRVTLDSLTPVVELSAVLLSAPGGSYPYQGTGLVAECVAYGSPRPQITWSSSALQISDFSASVGRRTAVVTRDTVVNGLIVTYSTLHICPTSLDMLTSYFVQIECSTTNGVSSPLGQQSSSFVAAPFIQILAFDVRIEGVSPAFTFTFSGDYDPSEHGCFLDKLIFIDSLVNTTVEFRPQYPGRCVRQPNSNMMIVAYLDPRDYLDTLDTMLFVDSTLYVATDSARLDQFAPPLQFRPINVNNALSVTSFIPNVLPPEVSSFDMDLTNSQLLIHFDSFVIASTFDPMMFILQGVDISQDTGRRVTHTLMSSTPVGVIDIFVQTVCVSLSLQDTQLMLESQICSTRDNCAAYFTADLVDGLNGVPVANVPPTNPLTVSQYRSSLPNIVNGLFMNITLSYIGCQLTATLSADEIYVARVGEFITRIDCFADEESGNINPELIYEGALIEGMRRDWPLHVFYSYPRGLAAERSGRYQCIASNGNSITQYLQTENPYFRFTEGERVTGRLYDEISLTVLFAIQPPINFQQAEIRLVNFATSSAPTVEPTITKINDFRATIVFNRILFSLNGLYDVQLRHDSQVVAQTSLNIVVNSPLVSIFPPVATIFPGQQEIRLRCNTNSPDLPITWVAGNLITELSRNPVYSIPIPAEAGFPDLTSFTCIVRDPENDDISTNNIVERADAYVRNVMAPVTILLGGTQVLPDGHLRAINRIDNFFQCLGDASTNNTDLLWLAVRDGPQIISADTDFFQVQYNQNEANLTVINSMEPFLGKLRCYSPTTGASSTFTVATNVANVEACPGETTDSMWNIPWDFTVAGSIDVQPCPQIQGIQTFGFASRLCGAGGEWENTIDTSACSTASFNQLLESSKDLTQDKDFIQDEELRTRLTSIMDTLSNLTTPRVQGSHFPADLNTANLVTNDVIAIFRESIAKAVTLDLNTELAKIFNNLLNVNNSEGWRQSQIRYNGSSMLLTNMEMYGKYLSEALISPIVDTSQFLNGIMLTESNIEYGVRADRSEVNFPPSTSSYYPSARISITSTALVNQMAQVVVSVVMNNIQNFLPEQNENNVTARALTPVIFSQICSTNNCSAQTTFSGNDFATIFFTTTRTVGASNPRCAFWDARQGKWSTEGVTTRSQVMIENREFKSYRLVCFSNHLSSFSVIADVEVRELNFYTIPIFIGCGVVAFASFFAIFALILSCLVDSIRKYFTVAFLTHMSFIFSVLAAYATFIGGIEFAVEQRASCIAVAGILQYFFSAAFAWLYCETLIISMFDLVSKKWGAFIVFFLIGWGLPAIPTAISLGLINDQYGTTAHCWFYFDGLFQSEIVMAFIIPILALIFITLVFQLISCVRICTFMNRVMQGVVKKHTGRLLWCLILSNVVFILLLGSSWVFAMLYVNVYALDSVLLGWLFMGCSTALGIYIFVFGVSIVFMNQKVDYEYMHQEHTGLTYVRDPMKGSTYEMIDVPLPEGPVGRPRIIIPNPVFDDGFPSAYPKDYNDEDDTKLIEADLGEDEEEDLDQEEEDQGVSDDQEEESEEEGGESEEEEESEDSFDEDEDEDEDEDDDEGGLIDD